MISGHADLPTALRALREGAVDFAMKPIAIGDLDIRIEKALSRRELIRENRAYRESLSQLADELARVLDERWRVLTDLSTQFEDLVARGMDASEAYVGIQSLMASFISDLGEMAHLAKLGHTSAP